MTPTEQWQFLPVGYLFSVLIEAPVLVLLLSRHHPLKRRLFAGLWLTACTYPVVVIVLPPLFQSRAAYLAVAETFAPVAECLIFWAAYGRQTTWRDLGVIVLANLLSFGAGEVMNGLGVWEALGVVG